MSLQLLVHGMFISMFLVLEEILSEHYWWKFIGLLCRTVHPNPQGNWRKSLGHGLSLAGRAELSSAGVFTTSFFVLIYQDFSKSG